MTTRYKITITEMGERTCTIGGTWEKGAGDGGEYGYTPETKATRPYEVEVYQQIVLDLDLSAVVAVVNGIGQ